MNWFTIPLAAVFLFLLVMYCLERGRQKKIGLAGVIAIMILATPFFGYFIVEALPNHKKPCKWCGNKHNEADHCGLCGKNEAGESKTTGI